MKKLTATRFAPVLFLVALFVGCREDVNIPDTTDRYFKWVNAANSGLKSDAVYCIIERANGDLYLGTRDGLAVMRNGEIIEHIDTTNSNLPANSVFQLSEGGGVLWVRTKGGIAAMVNGSFRYYEKVNDLIGVSGICADDDGTLWISQVSGCHHYYPTTDQLVKIEHLGAKFLSYNAGQIYYAGGATGFGYIDESNKYVPILDENIPREGGNPSRVESIAFFKNMIYLGAQDTSLVMWDGGKWHRWTRYTNIPSGTAFRPKYLAADKAGNLYINHDYSQISVLFADGTFSEGVYDAKIARDFNNSDGPDFTINGPLIASDGRLYLWGNRFYVQQKPLF